MPPAQRQTKGDRNPVERPLLLGLGNGSTEPEPAYPSMTTRRRTPAGCRAAHADATSPPHECPMRVTGPRPTELRPASKNPTMRSRS